MAFGMCCIGRLPPYGRATLASRAEGARDRAPRNRQLKQAWVSALRVLIVAAYVCAPTSRHLTTAKEAATILISFRLGLGSAHVGLRRQQTRLSMTTHHAALPTASISPALVAAALDCLAYIPDGHQLEPALLIAVTRTITPDMAEADALLIRIRAAAIVLCDPRWPKWSAYFRAQDRARRAAFDHAVLDSRRRTAARRIAEIRQRRLLRSFARTR